MCKQDRFIRKVLSEYDFSVDRWRTKKHHVIHASHVSGRASVFVASTSPSCHRARKNFEALVRRESTYCC